MNFSSLAITSQSCLLLPRLLPISQPHTNTHAFSQALATNRDHKIASTSNKPLPIFNFSNKPLIDYLANWLIND